MSHSILWRRVDKPGHEFCRLSGNSSEWNLAGSAVFSHDGNPCWLDYTIISDLQWHTVAARVEGWVGDERVDVEVGADDERRWRLNGVESPQVLGCLEIDLNFSPSTNLFPIRRFNLAVGEKGRTRAAWLRFPSFALEPLEQTYERVDVSKYRYQSAGGRFVTELDANPEGLVTRYPGFWEVVDSMDVETRSSSSAHKA